MIAARVGAGVALIAALALVPAAARAQDEDLAGRFSHLHYEMAGGLMAGVGPQGVTLRRGPFGSFNVHGESALGMEVGVEAAYAGSADIFHTHFSSLGAIARLSPVPEDYRAYVQLGAAAYHISYHSDTAGLTAPGSTTRPGGSFGLGLELIDTSNFSLGGLVTYNGVVINGNTARSYLVGALTVTFKPSAY